jgi:predicted Zn finger-like uncharacterized protein
VYTQCSKCETVFKLSAEVLRAAGGQVRCGKCGEVFNALARLAEDSSGFAAGESLLELEARADSILETMPTPQIARAVAKDYEEFAPPGVEIAQLEVQEWSERDPVDRRASDARDARDARDASNAPDTPSAPDAPDAPDEQSLEFTLPPGELDRIFVESKQRAPRPDSDGILEYELDPESDPEPDLPLPAHPESPAADFPATRQRISGLEVPEDVRREMLAGFEQDMLPAGAAQRSTSRAKHPRQFMMWLGAAIVATLLLIVQILHHGPLGAVARAMYGALGAPLPAPANLSAYQLRQWGVTGDPEANGKLRLRASILNTAPQLQPYPLLRVTLADRFGKSIGARDFEPSEYLGKPIARLLAPGERADATLEILDPGKNAEGFEIDVCVRGVDQKISCANDAAPQAKR